MDKNLYIVTMGGLLHDIGKLVQRADKARVSHPQYGAQFLEDSRIGIKHKKEVLDIIKYHHFEDIRDAKLDNEHLAYIVYEADNIAAAADRRKIEDGSLPSYDTHQPLQAVFNLIQVHNSTSESGVYKPLTLREEDGINYPQDTAVQVSDADYARLKNNLEENLRQMNFDLETPNTVLKLLEAIASYIPSSTDTHEIADISLFDHMKMTAAISSCMYLYLKEKGDNDYKRVCYDKSGSSIFRKEDAFLLVSADISGIQDFIYTISSKGALKSLRARSFYLEMMLEHIADEILEYMNLTRANLIYSGGGHFYMLLPNTRQADQCLEKARNSINQWLFDMYSTSLYIEIAALPVSANVLMNKGESGTEENLLGNAFQTLSAMLACGKMSRYSGELLRKVMSVHEEELADAGRECVICRTSSSDLIDDESAGGQTICKNCMILRDIGAKLGRKGGKSDQTLFIAVSDRPASNGLSLELPDINRETRYMSLIDLKQAEQQAGETGENYLRLYSINSLFTGVAYVTNLWVGMYSKPSPEGHVDFNELAHDSRGIKRLAVMRADVDNLGMIFSRGLEQQNEQERYKYSSLSRTATLSRQLSLFFKKHINYICQEGITTSWSTELVPKPASLVIVYSGGDDLFVVGAWDQVIDFSIQLREAFQKFTCGHLTFSAGIGLFRPGYPISQMAAMTEQLESAAKENPGKDSVALFGLDESIQAEAESARARHLYHWDEFINGVINDKYRFLINRVSMEGSSQKGKIELGKTALYHWMNLLQGISETGDRLNLARMAYHLGRIDPGSKTAEDVRAAYEELRQNIYRWANSESDRHQLLTALNLLIYHNRKQREEGGQ